MGFGVRRDIEETRQIPINGLRTCDGMKPPPHVSVTLFGEESFKVQAVVSVSVDGGSGGYLVICG